MICPANPTSLPATTDPPIAARPDVVSVVKDPASGLPLQWAVQLGAFSKAEAAQAIKRRAEQAGFHAIVQTVPTDSGTLHKVYVNPKLDRAEAQALAAQVEKKLAVKGYVTRYYP